MNKLKFSDFKVKDGGYMSYTGKNCEICFERCLNGCDIAVYDLKQNLLEDKQCTDIPDFNPSIFEHVIKVRSEALKVANKFYQTYEKRNIH